MSPRPVDEAGVGVEVTVWVTIAPETVTMRVLTTALADDPVVEEAEVVVVVMDDVLATVALEVELALEVVEVVLVVEVEVVESVDEVLCR